MDPDGNRLQNSCSPRHWGHSTMHQVPPVSGTTTTMYSPYKYHYWIRMATDYKIVVDALSAPSVWDYNYYVQPVQVPLQGTISPSLTQIVQEGIDVIL